MRLPKVPKDLALLTVLCVMLVWLVMIGAQAPARQPVTADSSAIVVLAENRTSVPTEIFFKRDSTYDRLGACPPATRCLYVIPSARLGALAEFRLAGLAHGEAVPTDSPPYKRTPGTVNVPMYILSAGEAPAAREGRATHRVY